MARRFCKHYRGMHEKDACEAGVEFSTLEHYGTKQFMASCPCFGPNGTGACDHKIYPTAEEIAEEDAWIAERMANVGKAREAIVKHCGGPWKKGDPSKVDVIGCPVCGGKSLHFSRAGYNGHIHAKCQTDGCVGWVE